MSDETAILQMIRVLPMVEALHNEARTAVTAGMGTDAADYCVSRINTYVQKVTAMTGDDLLNGLELRPDEQATNEQKIQQVMMASSELCAYLRQRVGIAVGESAGGIGHVHNAPCYNGCHFTGFPKGTEQAESS